MCVLLCIYMFMCVYQCLVNTCIHCSQKDLPGVMDDSD